MKQPPVIKNRIIVNEMELRELLKGFDGDSTARKTLADGFNLLKNRFEIKQRLKNNRPDIEDFGGYIPAPLMLSETISTLDNFIEKQMGGHRNGLMIEWIIGGVKWMYDPVGGILSNSFIS